MDRESMEDVVVVGHWITGTGLALRLAIEHPERIRVVVLLAGAPRSIPSNPDGPVEIPIEDRVQQVDQQVAPGWFKSFWAAEHPLCGREPLECRMMTVGAATASQPGNQTQGAIATGSMPSSTPAIADINAFWGSVNPMLLSRMT